MQIDHFDGKSIARKSMKWLSAAAADAYAKRQDSREYPAHVAMWDAKATKYSAEIERRERRAGNRV